MNFNEITDIHISVDSPTSSLIFPGPEPITPPLESLVREMLTHCQASTRRDFMITYDNIRWRVRYGARALDGAWYRIRRMPEVAPTLESLPTPLPNYLSRLLLSPDLQRGGLIFIIGAPGTGKTTTASATVLSRLHHFGGFAYTVEDPPEMPLNGWQRGINDSIKGFCSQNTITDDSKDPWGEALQEALRSQPAGNRNMLYVGEVREASCARAILRAAANGFLVIATSFGQDIVNGLDALVRLAGGDVSTGEEFILNDLASCLRLVVHQRLENKHLVTSSLLSAGPTSPVAATIRVGKMNSLKDAIERQSNQHKNNLLLDFKSE